jgi:cobalt-precorrin-5B (C1)-methyltransferase
MVDGSSLPAPPGFILPVWLAAAARAAVQGLLGEPFTATQPLELEPGAAPTAVPVEAAAPLAGGWVLAAARADPGPEVLDLTRDQPVWVQARWRLDPGERLELVAGEGVGVVAAGGPCLSTYARELLQRTLEPLVPADRRLELHLVIPAGRRLAERTSNAAFGVVDGLALIGTQAVVQRSAAPDQLQLALDTLRGRVGSPDFDGALVLVIGENGLDLAPRLGLAPHRLVKAGNWLGPLLVAAAEEGVADLLLFGHQGKLLKLAGGIFHTHHHLADGRAEVLTALAALEGLGGPALADLHGAPTVEAALAGLQQQEGALAGRLRCRIAAAIEERSAAYLARYGQSRMAVGAVLFDRGRRICAEGPRGGPLLRRLASTADGASRGGP